MKKSTFICGLLSVALVACQTAEPKNEEPIKIGFIGPLTGDIAAIGSDTLNALKLAVKETNEAGGIDGRTVQVVAEDGRCTGSDSASAAQKLINIDQVTAIIGGQCSGETLAAAPIAESMGIPMVSPVSSSADVTDAGDFIFRTYPSDELKGKAFGEHFKKNELNRVAVITENTDFCQGILTSIKKYLPEGVEIVFEEVNDPSSKDFRTLLTRLKEVEFDVMVINTQSETTGGALVSQMKELGFEQPAIGSDTTDSAAMFELASGLLDNMSVISVPQFDEESSFNQKFIDEYTEAQFGIAFAAHAYDASNVLLNTMKEVGTDGIAIKDALYAMPSYKGVAGTFTFDSNGDALGFQYARKGFKDGKIYEIEKISFE